MRARSWRPSSASSHRPTTGLRGPLLLSNGRYAVMLTAAGSGYSRCADLAITRWREDVTRDPWGTYIFLRDVQSGAVWSAGYQPTGVEPDAYRATFFEDRAEFHRRDGAITTTLDVLVSPEDDAETRRVSVTNLGARPREIEITSYAELVLAPPAAEAAHPVFSNLFVHTESIAARDTLLATRRVRSATRAGRLGRPHRGRRGPARRGRPVRDGPGAVPRPGAGDPHADVDHRPPAAVQHGGRGARPDLQSQAAGSAGPGRERARRVLHARRRLARRRPGPGRQVSRPGDVRAHRHAVLDPRAGAVPPPRDRIGGDAPVPGAGQPDSVRRPGAAASPGRAQAQPRRAARPLASWDLRRPPDRAGAHRRARGPRHCPPAAARSRVLAHEGPRRRSRHPERAGSLLRAGAPGVPGDACPHQPVGRAARAAGAAGTGVHPAAGSRVGSGARRLANRRSGRAPQSAGNARGAARPRPASGRPGARSPGTPDPDRSRRSILRRSGPPWSSSTASAASPTTGAST